MLTPSVVVHYFDVSGSDARPYEANAPLVGAANAVLTLSITLQSLKPISRRGLQKVQSLSCLELSKLAFCNRHERLELPWDLALVKRLRFFALERLDHVQIVLRCT